MNPLIASYLTQLRAEGKSPATIEARYWFLTAVDADLTHGICDVLPEEIAAYMAYPHWSPWTRATYYGHLASFYAYAVIHDPRMGYNPMADMQRPAGSRGMPDPVIDAELEYAYAESDDWWRLVIGLAAYAGLRAGEICAIERRHVNAEWVRVEHGKGDKTRTIPTHPELWELVASRPEGHLIYGQKLHRPVDRHRLTLLAREHFDNLGLPHVHLHRLRAWFATKQIQLGHDITEVRESMGHASLSTTQIYVLVTGGQRRRAVNSLPSLAGGFPKSPSTGQADMIPTHRLEANVPSSAQRTEIAR